MGTCKNCKYWYGGKGLDGMAILDFKNGKCVKSNYMIYFNQFVEYADEYIEDGNFGGDNLWTNENFGCINFEENGN